MLFAALILGAGLQANAQEEQEGEGNAPQVLTSDLFRKQVIRTEKVSASFIFLDSDKIVEIKFNGVAAEFEPDNAIVINMVFEIDAIEVIIEVSATDERGNTREKSYLVIREEPPIRSRPVSPLELPFSVEPMAIAKPPLPTEPMAPKASPPAPASYATVAPPIIPVVASKSVWPLWTGTGFLAGGVLLYLQALSDISDASTLADESRQEDNADKWTQANDKLDSATTGAQNATIMIVVGGGLLWYYYTQDPGSQVASAGDPLEAAASMPLVLEADPEGVRIGLRLRF